MQEFLDSLQEWYHYAFAQDSGFYLEVERKSFFCYLGRTFEEGGKIFDKMDDR